MEIRVWDTTTNACIANTGILSLTSVPIDFLNCVGFADDSDTLYYAGHRHLFQANEKAIIQSLQLRHTLA
jgi:hypothetical protein